MVHPHACGEYVYNSTGALFYNGPSPRVWGIHQTRYQYFLSIGSIPTRVGNTLATTRRTCAVPVHPHACGEYPVRGENGIARSGPSPRVWGIHPFSPKESEVSRSIPTRVGNTMEAMGAKTEPLVHPHACGEYDRQWMVNLHIHGPSPRVWGIHQFQGMVIDRYRSIPTRVGNTSGSPMPPRCRRSIPTRVGNTDESSYLGSRNSVHPHACGEYNPSISMLLSDNGPSPRVWGIHA